MINHSYLKSYYISTKYCFYFTCFAKLFTLDDPSLVMKRDLLLTVFKTQIKHLSFTSLKRGVCLIFPGKHYLQFSTGIFSGFELRM